MDRRSFLRSATAMGFWIPGVVSGQPSQAPVMEPWTPGTLDIHHLAYGRGNSTFVLCPDATTLLIDAGTTENRTEVSSPQKPDASIRPGEWIARYILRQMRAAQRRDLDYFLLTHLHPDHLGDLGPLNPQTAKGEYRLTGVMDIDARMRIGKVIDRGFPSYDYPLTLQAPFAVNYLKYIKSRQQLGEACERIQAGGRDQITLVRDATRYPDFLIRNLAANGEVWTGTANGTRRCFPDLRSLQEEDYPTENMCSIAIRISYGAFDYYSGGDLTCDTEETDEPWRDIETPVARAAGQVDVAVANHHGYFDAVGPNLVRLLRSQVFIIQTWYVAHPSIQPLRRMLSRRLYQDDRDVYATSVMAANRVVNNQFISKLKSLEGHVVVRVPPGGTEFFVIILDNTDDSNKVKAVFGPYHRA